MDEEGDRRMSGREDIDANAIVMCEGVNLCAASDAPVPTIYGREIMGVWYGPNIESMILTKNGRTSRRTAKQTVPKARTKALKSKYNFMKFYKLIRFIPFKLKVLLKRNSEFHRINLVAYGRV
jgi:hypothetical protein